MKNIERLFELFTLDGYNIVWNKRQEVTPYNISWNKRNAGRVAGSVQKGRNRVVVWVDGKNYPYHKLLWAMHYGIWPEQDLDHIDGNALNNELSNLRLCSHQDNMKNKKKYITNTSGHKGVSWVKKLNKWKVKIVSDKVEHYLGLYEDLNEASKVYKEASKKYHKEFARAYE